MVGGRITNYILIPCLLGYYLASSSRLKRDFLDTKQIIEVVCSACEQRLTEKPPPFCCRCVDERASCNNDIGSRPSVAPGLTCPDLFDCELFESCSSSPGCDIQGTNIIDQDSSDDDYIDLKQGGGQERCSLGQKLCCNPVDSDTVVGIRLGLVSGGNPLGEPVNTVDEICSNSKLTAVQDFGHGVTCGKRDSRVYYDANLPPSFTNPGEWPWAALIFRNGKYIGAGALLDNDVVVTVGHKVKDFVNNPNGLTVRLGDWNPNTRDRKEEHPHITVPVGCVKLHPDADLGNTLANNIAVLKLARPERLRDDPEKAVASVIDLKSAPQRPANAPEGVSGFSKVDGPSVLDLRLGLVANNQGKDPLGDNFREARKVEMPSSYINTVCIPQSERQFQNFDENCWVAAWGQDLKRQREIHLPLLSDSECERRLSPIFNSKGVKNWKLQPSEICAGGVLGEDTCQGEGGAPLVCYDKGLDQYFAVGLVNYGFGCNGTDPAVYTNLADASVQRFITRAFGNDNYC